MATSQANRVIEQLRKALQAGGAGVSDGQLLACFVEHRDEAAFEALVRRHGPMVHGLCRRLLGNHHDAEDAFQAAFLVLARKAAAIKSREALASWLYGVAYNVAQKARAMTLKRRARERQVAEMPEPEAVRAACPRSAGCPSSSATWRAGPARTWPGNSESWRARCRVG
jgi:hypothetical protein